MVDNMANRCGRFSKVERLGRKLSLLTAARLAKKPMTVRQLAELTDNTSEFTLAMVRELAAENELGLMTHANLNVVYILTR